MKKQKQDGIGISQIALELLDVASKYVLMLRPNSCIEGVELFGRTIPLGLSPSEIKYVAETRHWKAKYSRLAFSKSGISNSKYSQHTAIGELPPRRKDSG